MPAATNLPPKTQPTKALRELIYWLFTLARRSANDPYRGGGLYYRYSKAKLMTGRPVAVSRRNGKVGNKPSISNQHHTFLLVERISNSQVACN